MISLFAEVFPSFPLAHDISKNACGTELGQIIVSAAPKCRL
jgi:hypothetical protein